MAINKTFHNQPWKTRRELPLAAKLPIQFDPEKLLSSYLEFSSQRDWDSLGTEYMDLCENHRRLPEKFFKEEELQGLASICDLDWDSASYQQQSLTKWADDFDLSKRKSKSYTNWDLRIAKGSAKADERWYRSRLQEVPEYYNYVLDTLGKDVTHRARFAKLKGGSQIKPHTDYDTTYGIRVHIPIVTNEGCRFGGINKMGVAEEFKMDADGSVWFINPGLKHWAYNKGDGDRVHLIVSIDSHDLISHL